MPAPEISILIPTRDRRELLRRALLSIAKQETDAAYEVLVAVDGSTDGTTELVQSLSGTLDVRARVGPSRGRAGALNGILEEARGDLIVILDDDMRVVPDFLERHRRHHASDLDVCVMGAAPVELGRGSTHAARYIRDKFAAHMERLAEPGHVFVPRDFYSGNVSLPARVLRAVGGFDDSFTLYGNEDVELSIRLRAAGVRLVFDDEAVAWQAYSKTLRGLLEDTVAKGRTTVLLARKHPDVFDQLRLAAPDDASRPWLALRALLLAAGRRRPGTVGAALAGAGALERAGLWRQPLFYRAVTDYAFWVGVGSVLQENEDDERLRALYGELRLGSTP